MAPVRYKCERVEVFPATESKPALVMDDCEWEVADGVKVVTLECPGSATRYIVTRNMDDMRHKYAWRITRFDMADGKPYGHGYGKSPAAAMNKGISAYEKCKVTKVRTQGGRDDFGKLTTTLTSSAPTREARRVVAAFLRGETAKGACTGKGEARKCVIVSRRNTLEVGGEIVASRDGRNLSICVPAKAAMEKRGKRQRETEAAKDVRVAASALLRRVAGVGVRTDAEGQRLLAAGGRASLVVPGACIQVRISKRDAARLLSAGRANEAAEAQYSTEFPTQAQLLKVRRGLRVKQRNEALTKAQEKRRIRVGPSSVLFPEEEYAPETEAPEAPLPEYAPVEYEAPYEDETYDFEPAEVPETAPIPPSDVPHPTDPAALLRFKTEFIPRLRSPERKKAAEAWADYLTNPEGARRPGAVADSKVVREIENILLDKYDIVDPIEEYIPPDLYRRAAQYDAGMRHAKATRIRKGKAKGGGVTATEEQLETLRANREGQDTGYKLRKQRAAQIAREMRELRKGIKVPKIRNLKKK